MNGVQFCLVTILWIFGFSFGKSETPCGPPPVIDGTFLSEVNVTEFKLGTILTYSCDTGYKTDQALPTTKCILQDDGTAGWTNFISSCIRIICENPGNLENGKVKYKNLEYGSEVEYECEEGFAINGTQKRICQANGRLNGTKPTCIVSCGPPPEVARATVSLVDITEFKLGTVLKYSCDFGYVTDQALPTIKCIKNEEDDTAVWTHVKLNCLPRSCGAPETTDHAEIIGSLFTFPNSVTYVCDDGYKLVGLSKRFCQTNGRWSGNSPFCKRISCKQPEKVLHGHVMYENLEYGSEIEYECDKGFLVNGTKKRICGSDGTWSDSSPTCIETYCSYPESPDRGKVDLPGRNPKVDSIALYSCNEGLKLVGSNRATCLASGEWTFPPPECRDPCTIPPVPNGALVYKKSYYKYEEIPVGTPVDDDMRVFLKCSKNYEPMGQQTDMVQLSCINGLWSNEPKCIEASCRSSAPHVSFARLKTTEITHGTVLTYNCNQNYYKAEVGKVTCEFGNWRGKRPVCKDARCKTQDLEFSGMVPIPRRSFNSDQSFKPYCKDGYVKSTKGNGIITCVNGKWSGAFPPCIPIHCQEPPPVPENGRTETYTGQHGTGVKYTCNSFFDIEESTRPIKCQFGKWEGELPKCLDSRCYLDSLKNKEGIDFAHSGPTFSGHHAEMHCLEGYTLQYPKPKCIDGRWQSTKTSRLCQPSLCSITRVQNGELKYAKVQTSWFSSKTVYEKAHLNMQVESGSVFFLACELPYIFHGKDSSEHVQVKCENGKWSPPLSCRKRGDFFTTTSLPDRKPYSASISPVPEKHATTSTILALTKNSSLSDELPVTQSPQATAINTEMTTFVENTQNCTCMYNVKDKDLLAYLGYKLLNFGDEVRNGCTVHLICRVLGYHRLRGPSELTCRNCSWHSSEFPSCLLPAEGEPIIFIRGPHSDYISYTPSGIINIVAGVDIDMFCKLKDVQDWPLFNGPSYVDVSYITDFNEAKESAERVTQISIKRISAYYDGNYTCSNRYGEYPFYIKIQVEELRCPFIEEKDGVLVTYEGENRLHDTASFSCYDKNKRIYGAQKITCLDNGVWSANVPICESNVQCPEIQESEGLTIIYTNGRRLNSSAHFHCKEPYRRTGYAFVTCLSTGRWADESATCTLPTCLVDSVNDILPESVSPNLENVTGEIVNYGTILKIMCHDENHHMIGDRVVTCGESGTWLIGDVQCILGCGNFKKTKDSSVIVHQEKDVYRFGESITLSCPPGQSLTPGIQRVICLKKGWSDEPPDCLDTIV